jgi:transposase
MITNNETKFTLRREMVMHAEAHGIKDAAREYECARNTVRCFLRRYRAEGNDGLFDRSRRPHHSPNKTPMEVENLLVEKRELGPGFGVRRLIEEFELPLGHNAAQRIIRERGLTKRRKKKKETQRDLRAVKAAYRPFTRVQLDVKYLNDIPFYWRQMVDLKLPRFQYTFRDESTGATFVVYGDELSKTFATLAVKRFLEHLQRNGIDTKETVIKTDLGIEFDGNTIHFEEESFHRTIEKFQATHRFNPPQCPNANADVESIHNTIENEFFDAVSFKNRTDFFEKITTYQNWYNLKRTISTRGHKSPATLLREKLPHLSPRIFLLNPIPLESILPTTPASRLGGQHLPGPVGIFDWHIVWAVGVATTIGFSGIIR